MGKQQLPWWLYLPLIALLGLVLYHPAKQMDVAMDVAAEKRTEDVPLESYQKLYDERMNFMTHVMRDEKPGGNPETLAEFAQWRISWRDRVNKYISAHPQDDNIQVLLAFVVANNRLEIHARYQETFGATVMQAASRKFELAHPVKIKNIPTDYSKVGPAIQEIYMPCIFIWVCILSLYAHRNNLKMICEWPRIAVASLFPIASLVVYPIRLDKTRQARSALEFACGCLMLVFSFGTAAGSLAKAQTGPFGGKSTKEKSQKKKFFAGTLTLTTGVSSELPAVMSGGIFDSKPNLQTTTKVALDNGFYGVVTLCKALDHVGMTNFGDWLIGTMGYTKKFGRTSLTVEGVYMDNPSITMVRGDYPTVRGTIARSLGKNGEQGTLSGTVRGMWKMTGKVIDGGPYGYVGYARSVKVPRTPISLAPSTELRIDPGNLGRGRHLGFAGKLEFVLPKFHRWFLRPFVGTQEPIVKERPIRTDNRSWEVFGGFTLAIAPIRI